MICQNFLTTSLPKLHFEKPLNNSYEALDDEKKSQVMSSKRKMGQVKCNSLRKTSNVICNGKDIPKYNYTFRVDEDKLITSIHFLQESLQIKPGTTRNVKVSGHIFRDMYVYDRGGVSIKNLVNSYSKAYEDHEHVGKHTFVDMIKLLTK